MRRYRFVIERFSHRASHFTVFTPAAWRWQLCLRAGMSAVTLPSLALLTNSPEPDRARDPVEARRDRPVLLEQGEAERRAAQAALADAIRHDEDV
jgi:hypothetical protein